MGYWLKSYTDILDDPKYHKLSERAQLAMHEVFLVAKMIETDELTGLLPCIEDIAFYSRKSVEFWNEAIPELIKSGIVRPLDEGYLITNYVKRQEAIPPTIRAKQSKKKNLFEDKEKDNSNRLIDEYDIPKDPGVYKITCTNTGAFYIGASKNINHRVSIHLSDIKNNYWHPLYDDFNAGKCDYKNIRVDVLEICNPENNLGDLENKYINENKDNPNFKNKESYGKNHYSWSEEATNRWGDREDRVQNTDKSTEKIDLIADKSAKPEPVYRPCTEDGLEIPKKTPKKRQKPDGLPKTPAIIAFRRITGHYPKTINYQDVIGVLGENPDEAKIAACYKEWCGRGYNPNSINWLDWYKTSIPPRGKNQKQIYGNEDYRRYL